MNKFIYKTLFVFVAIYLFNLAIGYFIRKDNLSKAELGIFYPPKRWNDFYSQPRNTVDVVFLGASLCNKGVNPEVFDKKTDANSFNMGSSIQTVTTSLLILPEILEYQKPKVIFFDVFTRTFTIERQIEGVRYNLNYMKFGKNSMQLFFKGLSLKEKIEYLFPSYSMRDQLNRIVKYSFNSLDTSKLENFYSNKGYIKSLRKANSNELKSLSVNEFGWEYTQKALERLKSLDKIISICKTNNIKLVLMSSPLPQSIYSRIELDRFEQFVDSVANSNDLLYLNMNKVGLILEDTVHFKDHHLNCWGAEVATEYLANFYTSHFTKMP